MRAKEDCASDRIEQRSLKKTSKFLSLILRHKPETIGLKLDAHGWANVDELIELAQEK